MNNQPDAAWRLKWLQSKDGLEIELGPSAKRDTKSAPSRGSRIVIQKSKRHLWR
jgi:hypothetical protein